MTCKLGGSDQGHLPRRGDSVVWEKNNTIRTLPLCRLDNLELCTLSSRNVIWSRLTRRVGRTGGRHMAAEHRSIRLMYSGYKKAPKRTNALLRTKKVV